MRLTLPIALLALLLSDGPAAADIRARYRTGGGDMIVQVNDRGDSRIDRGGSAVVTIEGVSYVVASDAQGDFAVRQDEMLAEIGRRERERNPPVRDPLQLSADSFRAAAAGTESVGGRTGIRWTLRMRNGVALSEGLVFVISRDADLAPLGGALARQFSIARYTVATADNPVGRLGQVPASLHRLIAAGTVIRVGTLFSLVDVEARPVPASAFALPATILPADRFLARATWIRPRVVD
jgi:hypothetical protein